jgi:hypothetical protein
MQYDTVFDACDAGYRDWPFVLVWLLFAGGSLAWLSWERRSSKPDRPFVRTALPYLASGFLVLWGAVTFTSSYRSYREVTSRLRAGQYESVEGTVTDFEPMPREGHRYERFIVAGHLYEYSDYGRTPGFNNSSSHGGPIRPGLHVRIADIDGLIARLEILRTTEPKEVAK